ncbi:MAG: hypothetical protein V2A66_09925 [Pseudomonadota bacterium]
MSLNSIQPDLVRFEMRTVQGQDPHEREQKKPGWFGRFLSGAGRVLGAIAAPLSFIFPPAAIAAAGMYGLGSIGDMSQAKSQAKAAEKQQRENPTQVSFPGLNLGGSSPIEPASFDISASEGEIMKVLDARAGAMSGMAQRI